MTGAPKRTARRRSGDRAELIGARQLQSLGWVVLARNVMIGRDEMDLVAIDPGPPAYLVFVEVRSNATGRFGAPEETVAGRKVRRTYRAALALLRASMLPTGIHLPDLAWRVDVLVLEGAPALSRFAGGPAVRHIRGVTPE